MTTIKLRRGNASDWATSNPILAAGEPAVELDTLKVKVGNGVNNYTSLPYVFPDSASSKLAGIQTGATKNDTDASLRDRSTHTGSISITDVTSLAEQLAAKITNLAGTQIPRVVFYSSVGQARPSSDAGILIWWIATTSALGLPTNAVGNDITDLEA